MKQEYMQESVHKAVKKAKMMGRGPGRDRMGWGRKRLRRIEKQWYIN